MGHPVGRKALREQAHGLRVGLDRLGTLILGQERAFERWGEGLDGYSGHGRGHFGCRGSDKQQAVVDRKVPQTGFEPATRCLEGSRSIP